MSGVAVVVGASGGIGGALVEGLLGDERISTVVALARSFGSSVAGRLARGPIDVTDEASVAAAAERLPGLPSLVIVATGSLFEPEKTYRALDPAAMLRSYALNTVGPALVAKHLLPRMAPGRAVFAALSARVGSIGDNRAGGWHSYRASKAALNMIVRNLAIEVARKSPALICVALHPGTVDTALSRPFQRGVAEGKLFTPAFAAARLLAVIDGLQPEQSGCQVAWDGVVVPP